MIYLYQDESLGIVVNPFTHCSSLVILILLLEFRRPHSWYPAARRKKRNVILHVGPTNSGKTYHALKRLEASSTGMYPSFRLFRFRRLSWHFGLDLKLCRRYILWATETFGLGGCSAYEQGQSSL